MNKKTDYLPLNGTPQDNCKVKVIGVGGGGGNAVNHMFREGINDVDFILCDTDSQALKDSPIPTHVHMGHNELRPIDHPELGHQAAEEWEPEIRSMLDDGTKLSLVIAGMGGGTSQGAAPVVARISKELGILTIGIVTIPFRSEGLNKIKQALDGIKEMAKHVDTLFVFNNENLRESHPDMGILDAFAKSDETLTLVVKEITDIANNEEHTSLDFNDLRSFLKDGGVGFLAIGFGDGEEAVREAFGDGFDSPLLNDNQVFYAKQILFNIIFAKKEGTPGPSIEDMGEISHTMGMFGKDTKTRWAMDTDTRLDQHVKITILATGYELKDVDPLMAFHLREDSWPPLDKEQITDLIGKLRLSASHGKLFFPWEHVFESMMYYHKKVCVVSEKCPECGEDLVELYFSTPGWTWRCLCGRAGDMRICPKCRTQNSFHLTVLN